MTARAAATSLERPGQIAWGAIGLGAIGSILLESHTPFTAWYHGGSFRIMLNFLFSESLHQIGQHALR